MLLLSFEKALASARYAKKIAAHGDRIPAEARKVINEELNKLKTAEAHHSELSVARSYLDWLVAIPWGRYTQEKLDIEYARKASPPICSKGQAPLYARKPSLLIRSTVHGVTVPRRYSMPYIMQVSSIIPGMLRMSNTR